MFSSLTSSIQSFVQPIGIAPVGILAVLSVLVIAGLVASIYQEVKLRKITQGRRRLSEKSVKLVAGGPGSGV
jgi:hypothetical protein